MSIREVTSNSFHPLFFVLARRATKANQSTPAHEGNHQVALVTYAENLLDAIFKQQEKSLADYKKAEKRVKKAFDLTPWFSSRSFIFDKLHWGFNLLAVRSAPLDGFIRLADLSNEVKQNTMFEEALELLNDARLIDLGKQYIDGRVNSEPVLIKAETSRVKITDAGKEHLHKIDMI